ncbi:cupin domain-containing protein [Paraburkholderia sediminicola]|uniref:Cupin domain-containing protein n=1 Tax=Paraburkholderia metrosideri TaxID=580937 RepID=A0ABW9E476_9BURK
MTHDPSTAPQFRWSDSNDVPWIPSTLAKGVEVKNLGKANGRAIQLVRFAPGAAFPDHLHTGPEFIYVLEGEVTWNGRVLGRGNVGVAETGTVERGFHSMTGCVFLLAYDLDQIFDSVRPASGQ